jgi:hypothetical protein
MDIVIQVSPHAAEALKTVQIADIVPFSGLPAEGCVRSILLTVVSAALLAPAVAMSAPPTAAPPEAATVSELAVTAAANCLPVRKEAVVPPPQIVSTYPSNGAVVRPGVLVVRVTFDQSMSCQGFFAGGMRLPSPCPEEHQAWVLSYDRRTIRTVCRVNARSDYGLFLSDRPGNIFVSLAGKPAAAYSIAFSSSGERDVLSVKESMAEDDDSQPVAPRDEPLKVQELHIQR